VSGNFDARRAGNGNVLVSGRSILEEFTRMMRDSPNVAKLYFPGSSPIYLHRKMMSHVCQKNFTHHIKPQPQDKNI
jgi:hypothetical protein